MESIALDFGDGNGEVIVYYGKRNLDQMESAIKAADDGHVELLVTQLVTRAMRESGGMMFCNSDRKMIRKDYDPEAVLAFTLEINKFDRRDDDEAGN